MSNFTEHIKIALENAVMVRSCNPPKESYDYAYRMEAMLKRMFKEELQKIKESIEKDGAVKAAHDIEIMILQV